MCMMCMILSPNCCTVTIFEYSSTDVTLLPTELFVSSERTRFFAKQMAECRFRPLKLAKKRYSEVTCAFGPDKISNVSAGHFRSEVYSEVESELKHEVATIEPEFKI